MNFRIWPLFCNFLRKEDLFIDVGANVGSYTILTSKVIGGRAIPFEPVPSTFYCLKLNRTANEIEHLVDAHNIGCSDKSETLKFSSDYDTINHVLAEEDSLNSIEVPVNPLDEVLSEKPIMFKVDVEGFETKVLSGAQNTLKDESLKAIILELNGSGNRYGFDERLIHDNLLTLGFMPYQYEPFERGLTKLSDFGSGNTIYIRDIEMVTDRISTARPFTVWGRKI